MGELGFFIIVFCLYAKISMIGTYPVTIAGLFVPVFIVQTLIANRKRLRYFGPLAFLIVYPAAVYLMHVALETVYAVSVTRFFLSYSLWVVSVTTIWCGFQPRAVLRDVNPTKLLVSLLVLGAFQYFGLKYFHSTAGYDLIQPFSNNDFYSGYMNILASDRVRAVGPYYEPSMFGRVIATLALMLLAKRRNVLTFFAFAIAGYYVSSSFTIVIFALISVPLFLKIRRKHIVPVLLLLLLAVGLVWPIFQQRMGVGNRGDLDSSTMIRAVLPLYVLSRVLPDYPYGVPIGSNETVVDRTTKDIWYFTEPKITNGFYEAVMYFGIVFLIPFALFTASFIRSVRKKDMPMALAFFYLLAATGASNSYLSTESSLLIAFFTISMRYASSSEFWRILPAASRRGTSLTTSGSARKRFATGGSLPGLAE
jgi:hypothetical protein